MRFGMAGRGHPSREVDGREFWGGREKTTGGQTRNYETGFPVDSFF